MLTLYHEPISPNSRRVWIALLEKGLEFELVAVKLDGEQFKPDFLALNPFHHIPVLVDDGFNIVESLAILDYLEAKYPAPAMLPKDAKDLTIVRMAQLVAINEILPAMTIMTPLILGFPGGDPEKIEQAKEKISIALKFLENLLDDRPFFGSQTITLAEVVGGTIIPWLRFGGIPMNDYPKLNDWCDRLLSRPSWHATEATPDAIARLKSLMAARMGQQ